MPAAVVKGIIISISIITALGVAVLESPQIQAWLDQQRRKLIELLRTLGEELDAESRRAAESFAYEGRTPATDEGLRREVYGSIDAAAVATGRSLSGPSSIRRIPVHGPSTPDEAEERRRQGREYLARRNQQMFELQQRRRTNADAPSGTTEVKEDEVKSEPAMPPTPSTPTFDNLVDLDGKLRELEPRTVEDMSDVASQAPTSSMPQQQEEALHIFDEGARLANPFDDENALERSMTPRPLTSTAESEVERNIPIPSDEQHESHIQNTLPGSLPVLSTEEESDLTFEEQMAIALSLSEAESNQSPRSTTAVADHDDPDLRAAIAESLREFEAISAKAENPPAGEPMLVDVSSEPMNTQQQQLRQRIREWESLLPMVSTRPQPVVATATGTLSVASEGTDDLYTATPRLAHSPLQATQILQPLPNLDAALNMLQEDHLGTGPWAEASPEASFHSAVPTSAEISMADSTEHQVPHVQGQKLENAAMRGQDSTVTSDTESYASMSRAASVADSHAQSRTSGIEMLSAAEDTDHDVFSEDESGVLTPDSWSEVGSEDGEEGVAEHEQTHQPVNP